MNKRISNVAKTFFLGGILLMSLNCSKDLINKEEDLTDNVSAKEVTTILESDMYSSAADEVVTTIFKNRSSGKSSKSVDCYTTEMSDSGFVVNFDNCAVKEGGQTLNGTLTVTYNEGEDSTAFKATYANLTVDGVVINGTRNFKMTSGSDDANVSFKILSEMKITLADGSVIEEAGSKSIRLLFDQENYANSGWAMSGNWTVKSEENAYTVTITTDLVTSFNCAYIGKGIMALSKNESKATIDFGDGTCDDIANITYPDGTVEEISLKG